MRECLHYVPCRLTQRQYSSLILGAWVPFPAPGGPKKIVLIMQYLLRLGKIHYEIEISCIKSKRPATLRKSFKLIVVIGPSPSFFLLAASQASLKLTHELDGGDFRNFQRHFLCANSGRNEPYLSKKFRSIASRSTHRFLAPLLCGLSATKGRAVGLGEESPGTRDPGSEETIN